MGRVVMSIDPDIFTVSNVFAPEECRSLISRAEDSGFVAASVRTSQGRQMMTQLRNNDRIELNDPELSAELWNRIAPFLPILDGHYPTGVDDQLRFYRYTASQQFKRHKDGVVTNDRGETSRLSYLVYLNDDCEGGETAFREFRNSNGTPEKVEYIVSPSTGTALLFRHERWHEGCPVTSGIKYVLRTDVFYSKETAATSQSRQ
ncbi:MAG: 2OG-Fe(II) oxygenase [Planctomycetaceae bacterium]|nr:2OG-Fe(II) oxygenase [Planctomycetaceae bacterium]